MGRALPRPARPPRAHAGGLPRRAEFVKRAHAAGVPILAGSDTPNPHVVPGVSLHREIEELARAIGPEAALRAATLANADAPGREDLGRRILSTVPARPAQTATSTNARPQ